MKIKSLIEWAQKAAKLHGAYCAACGEGYTAGDIDLIESNGWDPDYCIECDSGNPLLQKNEWIVGGVIIPTRTLLSQMGDFGENIMRWDGEDAHVELKILDGAPPRVNLVCAKGDFVDITFEYAPG